MLIIMVTENVPWILYELTACHKIIKFSADTPNKHMSVEYNNVNISKNIYILFLLTTWIAFARQWEIHSIHWLYENNYSLQTISVLIYQPKIKWKVVLISGPWQRWRRFGNSTFISVLSLCYTGLNILHSQQSWKLGPFCLKTNPLCFFPCIIRIQFSVWGTYLTIRKMMVWPFLLWHPQCRGDLSQCHEVGV